MEQEKIQMMYTEAQHEREMTRMEAANRRWFIAFLIVLAMLFVTNAAWVFYENQFKDVVIEQDADSGEGGDSRVYGVGIGDLNYGACTPDNQDTSEEGQH